MYLLNKEKRYLRFSLSTYIIQVLNVLPAVKRHNKVHVQQDRLLCHTHVDNKKTQVLKCITRPDLSGVPLKWFDMPAH